MELKKYLLAGGLASVLVLGACGSDEPDVGEDASETDHGTSDEDEADTPVGEEGQDTGQGNEIGEGINEDEEEESGGEEEEEEEEESGDEEEEEEESEE
ncbi:hypothetical protein [Lacicoccus qingdaonensis]|uniref:Transcription elongation factor SPT5/acidic leucine-rich phosphoprotein 32 family member B/X-linked retinitis pigmentosa GTPase regulator n=1 Tax=Lacicoccus qingdaonensis TaxID=576118 RepID=A0A1G9GN60_9BACL|nr:hypothetical protein [Salinicoccus qingdaonensis]SDL02087.1 transcription elongation factor SPT5/acidic leucine-rich phosphoprotein 32 family member B/X-linked retinitis pigmentosa GTPase regulator [Salinicoccus qingdaonensis]